MRHPIIPLHAEENSRQKMLVVDDHPGFRVGLHALVRRVGELEICGETGNAEDAMQMFRQHHPAIVVMDICIPGGDGIGLTRKMCEEQPRTRVLVISKHDQPVYAARALRAGALGYLCKEDSLPELAVALRKVSRGALYISKGFANDLLLGSLGLAHPSATDFPSSLTPREREVFRLVGQGKNTRGIAEQLSISLRTVDTHRANITKKLNLPKLSVMDQLAREWHSLESNFTEPHAQNVLGFNPGGNASCPSTVRTHLGTLAPLTPKAD